MKVVIAMFWSVLISLVALDSHAIVIQSIPGGGTVHPFSPLNETGSGPISESGFTWTADTFSLYGFNGQFGLGDNGDWDKAGLVGLSDFTGQMSFTFDDPVSSVLAFINHCQLPLEAPECKNARISIFDIGDNLLESLSLDIDTPVDSINAGEYWGFSQPSTVIKTFVFEGAFIVTSDLRTETVPLPTTPALIGLALAVIFRCRHKDCADNTSDVQPAKMPERLHPVEQPNYFTFLALLARSQHCGDPGLHCK